MKSRIVLGTVLAMAMVFTQTSLAKDKVSENTQTKDEVVATKMTKKQARKQCKSEGQIGKKLKDCMNHKMNEVDLDDEV